MDATGVQGAVPYVGVIHRVLAAVPLAQATLATARLCTGRQSILCPWIHTLVARLTTRSHFTLHQRRPLVSNLREPHMLPPSPVPRPLSSQGGSLPPGSPAVVASQRVSDFLTPMDGEAAFLAAANKPYAVYAYRMAFFRQEQ